MVTPSCLDLLLELGKQIQRFDRLQVVEVRLFDGADDFGVQGREDGQLNRPRWRRWGRFRRHSEPLAQTAFAPLVLRENFSRALDDAGGKTGEARNFHTVTLVGAPRFD